jgi:hypothetical protein
MLVPVNVLPGVGDVSTAVGLTPVPLNGMLCVDPLILRALSVKTSGPLSEPTTVGEKLMGSRQDSPAAKAPGEEELELIRVQAEATLLLSVKFVEMLGLFPVDGMGKDRAALPSLTSVIVCGLSLLVEPTAVWAKVRLGGSAKSSFNTRLLSLSGMKTLPLPSNATHPG